MNYSEAERLARGTDQAIRNGDWDALRYCGNRFERGRYYKEAWKALATGVEASAGIDRPIWGGPDDGCPSLLVLKRSRDLGDELRIIRFVHAAAQWAEKVTALVEPRLIPLLQRSFPEVHFIDRDTPLDLQQFSHIAAQERLAYWFGSDEKTLYQAFQPLVAAHAAEKPRGIGISWYSRAIVKTLPSLQDWAQVLRDWRGRLQSLQYREDDAEFRTLSELAGRPIKTGRHIDQLHDLDAFAQAIIGLRGVLTISNTTAHMAGALGVPCVVVLDNGIVTTWPEAAETTPLYPQTRLIRRNQLSWEEALRQGRETLKSMIKTK